MRIFFTGVFVGNAAYDFTKMGVEEASKVLVFAAKEAGNLVSQADMETIIKNCNVAGNIHE